jgi:hypothetical protein
MSCVEIHQAAYSPASSGVSPAYYVVRGQFPCPELPVGCNQKVWKCLAKVCTLEYPLERVLIIFGEAPHCATFCIFPLVTYESKYSPVPPVLKTPLVCDFSLL